MAGEAWVVALSRQGKVKRMALEEFSVQHRGGKGITGAKLADGDAVASIAVLAAGEDLLAFTSGGRCVRAPWDKVPQMERYAQGQPADTVFALEGGEKITALLRSNAFSGARHIAIVTANGVVKRTETDFLGRLREAGVRVITLSEGDKVIAAAASNDAGEMLIASANGKAVRFAETDVRVTGRDSQGVTGIKMESGDHAVGLAMVNDSVHVLTLTEHGYGKRTPGSAYRKTARGTQGVSNAGDAAKVGHVVSVVTVGAKDAILMVTRHGKALRIPSGEVRETGRSAAGVKAMNVEGGDGVAAAGLSS
jgi:DNA gyrase subunit A